MALGCIVWLTPAWFPGPPAVCVSTRGEARAAMRVVNYATKALAAGHGAHRIKAGALLTMHHPSYTFEGSELK